jgi:cell division protein FtsI (penicillin-binding protein 3)
MAADYVLTHLGINTNADWSGSYSEGNPIWGKAMQKSNMIALHQEVEHQDSVIPDVRGMGAKDAVFLIEKRGVLVKLSGRGKVVKQSLEPGHTIKGGEVCMLLLE